MLTLTKLTTGKSTINVSLHSLSDTETLGQALAKAIDNFWHQGVTLYLEGDLGAGKTTLSRFIIKQLGHTGNVKSPTYTLVEPYDLPKGKVHHFDLYRLADPEELEYMGIRDYFCEDTLSIIEWSQKGANYLAPADLMITLSLNENRTATITGVSERGRTLLEQCCLTLENNN